ncbi:hypothetical protein K402DRAFT_399342 [Aulographum hederae CBS 113979]|uniref:Uncharacterized protein n=1 Tax=Aulographum hederae CBS 113979 TaxID=1176131 RepID=A0A6G1HGB0_9PEZI|nr:hypothetical protein K402DRAFT_399342 [Aulographum hederae CBS 113979]
MSALPCQTVCNMSPTLHLGDVPSEILLQICDYVYDAHQPSLCALGLVNKQYHAIANVALSSTVKIYVRGRNQLSREVDGWVTLLRRRASLKHVHRLITEGDMPLQRDDIEKVEPERGWNRADDRPFDRDLDPVDPIYSIEKFADTTPGIAQDEDDAWRPLAALIYLLPALQDLEYGCQNQFPPCLLQFLHQFRPHCRLHIRCFHLRTLSHPQPDKYEILLATSPCLYSIVANYQIATPEGSLDHNEEAVLSIASGLVPNLNQVRIFRDRDPFEMDEIPIPPFEQWGGFDLNERQGLSIGSLHHLRLAFHPEMTKQDALSWNKTTNFSALRSLVINCSIASDALDYLAVSCNFKSLQSLTFCKDNDGHNAARDEDESLEDCSLLRKFLSSLPPLSAITLKVRVHESTFNLLLKHHSSSVRQLLLKPHIIDDLRPFSDSLLMTADQICRMATCCPLLEDLYIVVPRTFGDDHEANVYRSLGSLRKLQTLSLLLNVKDSNNFGTGLPIDPYFDEFNRQHILPRSPMRKGHARLAMMNSAIDKTLGLAIFKSISKGKPAGSMQLESLRLQTHCGGRFYWIVDPICRYVGRWIELKRRIRDDKRKLLLVGRQDPSESYPWIYKPEIQPIFRKIWPERYEGSNWFDDWCSLPLAEID